ncbi:putative E3 ubiquitin-protein ligase mug30 [Zancudomyces culisetae]|uniref:HECT-type E3 ubiquitin transferase n=1 Tax=Zancudomyces culisetae TaxID=1213189 RepID=A0A1R1PZK9_ZANCU|nr:putative E3 ubiquitin-protein ligase mug30 [Zancudomyces culisetae]|eukprot:OMH86374.1 putative E3 ubiquitin-protein ligase mug30 [Zancudomyces culisetae]
MSERKTLCLENMVKTTKQYIDILVKIQTGAQWGNEGIQEKIPLNHGKAKVGAKPQRRTMVNNDSGSSNSNLSKLIDRSKKVEKKQREIIETGPQRSGSSTSLKFKDVGIEMKGNDKATLNGLSENNEKISSVSGSKQVQIKKEGKNSNNGTKKLGKDAEKAIMYSMDRGISIETPSEQGMGRTKREESGEEKDTEKGKEPKGESKSKIKNKSKNKNLHDVKEDYSDVFGEFLDSENKKIFDNPISLNLQDSSLGKSNEEDNSIEIGTDLKKNPTRTRGISTPNRCLGEGKEPEIDFEEWLRMKGESSTSFSSRNSKSKIVNQNMGTTYEHSSEYSSQHPDSVSLSDIGLLSVSNKPKKKFEHDENVFNIKMMNDLSFGSIDSQITKSFNNTRPVYRPGKVSDHTTHQQGNPIAINQRQDKLSAPYNDLKTISRSFSKPEQINMTCLTPVSPSTAGSNDGMVKQPVSSRTNGTPDNNGKNITGHKNRNSLCGFTETEKLRRSNFLNTDTEFALDFSKPKKSQPNLHNQHNRIPLHTRNGIRNRDTIFQNENRTTFMRTNQHQGIRKNSAILGSNTPISTGGGSGGLSFTDYVVGDDGIFYPKTYSKLFHGDCWALTAASKAMELFYLSNSLRSSKRRLPENLFLSNELVKLDLTTDFLALQRAQQKKHSGFSICQYPFLISLSSKVKILNDDTARQMKLHVKDALIDAIFMNPRPVTNFYEADSPSNSSDHLYGHAKTLRLMLNVRRSCLADDSLRQLSTLEADLKKPLKINFVGEDGVDAGGLTKEWFMLLVRELTNPLNAMFFVQPDSPQSALWFNPASLESSDQYFLFGVVVGLAIYNGSVLDLSFPRAVYKKLLDLNTYDLHSILSRNPVAPPPRKHLRVGYSSLYKLSSALSLVSSFTRARLQLSEMLDDLAEFNPGLVRGFRALLAYPNDDVQDVFCLTFEASYDAFGDPVCVPLVENGHQILVTRENRYEYVQRYCHWWLDTAIARQFEPFRRGFYLVCGGPALCLFLASELELLVRGSEAPISVSDLKSIAEYTSISESDPLIANLWSIVEELDPNLRRQFFAFITGNNRMPSSAHPRIKLKIVLLGDDETRLPIARTCFNQLGIYSYSTIELFRDKLLTAICNSSGFALK